MQKEQPKSSISSSNFSDEKIKTVILTTYLTYRISNKRTESVPPNYKVWRWGYTILSTLSICHTLNMSCIRATIWDPLISPASAILTPTGALLTNTCVKNAASESYQVKCKYQNLIFRQMDAPFSDGCLVSYSASTSVQNAILFTMPT